MNMTLPPDDLLKRFVSVRRRSEQLVEGLQPEDLAAQSMPDTSPLKWHLGHTTWFFETFLLADLLPGYRSFNVSFGYLFNSYYEAQGERQPRPERGLLTRPALPEVLAYRRHVDQHMRSLLQQERSGQLQDLLQLGLAHEEQHQELMLMDVLHLFSRSPLLPVYDRAWPQPQAGVRGAWQRAAGGLLDIGEGGDGFAFDNERPRHRVWLEPFDISDRLVTNGEWLEFMADGGYWRPEFWLSDGWQISRDWAAPLYWQEEVDGWHEMTLSGLRPIDTGAPVTHISYYEASAFAAWCGARLPSEAEWESAARRGLLQQVDDAAWQWTSSAYAAYPGYRRPAGATGEYNGKFMVSQQVLRGGAALTPPGHSRFGYRNFYRPEQRWMQSGLRLARDAARSTAAVPAPGEPAAFAADVLSGLSLLQKSIPPKYFYDARGSELFEAITRTPEYYPTRIEAALLRRIAGELAAQIPSHAALIEFGSGASTKTRLLLDAMPQLAAYVPIEISEQALAQATRQLARDYPALLIVPVVRDFTAPMRMPPGLDHMPRVGFFPGSTIGNFERREAVRFLRHARKLLGQGGRLIVGADLVKDAATLQAAYDDAGGVTAEFNRNLLLRMNRELGADFDPFRFAHEARWNGAHSRMEMHLVSLAAQSVRVKGRSFSFAEGETLHTESSHKYTEEAFAQLAGQSGWQVAQFWRSDAPSFAIFLLT